MRKPDPSPSILWVHIEAFAHFLPGDGPWLMIDDCQRLLDTLALVGGGVMCTLEVLEEHGLLRPQSPIRDLALVLGLLYRLDSAWPGGPGEEELSWVHAMVNVAQKHGIVFKDAPYGIEDKLKTRTSTMRTCRSGPSSIGRVRYVLKDIEPRSLLIRLVGSSPLSPGAIVAGLAESAVRAMICPFLSPKEEDLESSALPEAVVEIWKWEFCRVSLSVFRGVTKDDVKKMDREHQRAEIGRHTRFRYYNDGTLLVIKLMPSKEHEVAHLTLAQDARDALIGMCLPRHSLSPVGRTIYKPPNSSKEGDAAFCPLPSRELKADWPTIVFEPGVSESLHRLRHDAGRWIVNSEGDVKIIISIKLAQKRLVVEKWCASPSDGYRPATRANLNPNTPIPTQMQQLTVTQIPHHSQVTLFSQLSPFSQVLSRHMKSLEHL